MDPKSPDFHWALPNSASKIFDNKDGCIQKRLENSLPGNSNRRGMKFTGTTTSYRCTENEGSKTSFASISQAFSDVSYSFSNRQYNSLVLSCEDGGNHKQVFNRISKRNLEISIAPWDHNYCRISSKLHERRGRLVVKKFKKPFRVKTPSTSISENLSNQRKTRDGYFCFSTVSTTFTVHCMETRSIQSGNGCNAANLVQSIPLRFPTFFNDKQVLKKDSPGPSEKNVDCSSHMAVSSMVPNPSENVNRETTSFATPSTSSIEPPGSETSFNNKQNIKISGLDGFR